MLTTGTVMITAPRKNTSVSTAKDIWQDINEVIVHFQVTGTGEKQTAGPARKLECPDNKLASSAISFHYDSSVANPLQPTANGGF